MIKIFVKVNKTRERQQGAEITRENSHSSEVNTDMNQNEESFVKKYHNLFVFKEYS